MSEAPELIGILSGVEELTGILTLPESIAPPPKPIEPTDPDNCVSLYDYDGTPIAYYSAEDFQSLEEYPIPAHHNGLVYQGWNWPIEKAKEYAAAYGKLNVFATYIPSDGKTHVFIHIPEDNSDYSTSLFFRQSVEHGVSVDWGDGSPTESYAGITAALHTHTYKAPGDYEITLFVISGTMTPSGNGYNIQSNHFFGSTRYARNRQRGRAVWIGNGVELIGDCAFAFSEYMTEISIPNGVINIGEGAFYGCYALESIGLPDGVVNIGDSAFYSCHSIESASMPDSVRTIGSNAFFGCHKLHIAAIPRFADNFGTYVFQNCYSMKFVVLPSGMTGITDNMFGNCYVLDGVVLPDGITSIGVNAFYNCCALSSIEIPDGVTSIGINAFSGCYNLAEIKIPYSTSVISQSSFQNCYRLSNIIVQPGTSRIDSNAFSGCRGICALHMQRSSPPTLTNTNAFGDLPEDAAIYVPVGSLTEYKMANNWNLFANKMREESE